MRVDLLELYSYDLPLKRPLLLKNEPYCSRSGLLLKMSDGRGRTTACDIAPLPHFSPESLSDVLEAFSEFKKRLLKSYWSLKLLFSSHNILNNYLSYQKTPSLFFGIEFALLSLMMPKFSLFSKVQVNLLLMGTDEEILKKAILAPSYRAIKLKAGSRTPEELLRLIQKILPYLNSEQKLRIDINRSWTLSQALFFCECFPVSRCDYLEEPLSNPKDLLSMSHQTPHPLAFDESLLEMPLDFILSIPTKKAFVIKPTLLGSLQRMNHLYQNACKYQLDFILSSTFESGLGHLMIAHLNRFLALKSPIGLDTYSWFQEDLLTTPLDFSDGVLLLPQENLIKPDLKYERLKLLTI